MTTMPSTLSWQNWSCGFVKFKKEMPLFFKTRYARISQRKNLKNELKVEAEGQQRLLKQDFERYSQYLSNIELQQWKITRNFFCLNCNILFAEDVFGNFCAASSFS